MRGSVDAAIVVFMTLVMDGLLLENEYILISILIKDIQIRKIYS